MNLTLLEGYGCIPSYTRTDVTDILHKLFGFRTDYQITIKEKMRDWSNKRQEKNTIIRNNEKKVAQSLYIKTLDNFISLLTTKTGFYDFLKTMLRIQFPLNI